MRLLLMMFVAVVGIAPGVEGRAPQTPQPDIDAAELVLRASRWTARFDQNLSGVLFRERYLQRAISGNSPIAMAGPSPSAQQLLHPTSGRLTEANIFLLKAPTAREFVIYRDVYSDNSRKLPDHTDRLAKLLSNGTSQSIELARRLTDASARHNVGAIARNINVPTMALEYLTPAHVSGLRVRAAGRETSAGLDVIIVEFEETARPTLVRGLRDSDVPAHGKFWIHPESGAVVRALLELTGPNVNGRMEVHLQLHETLGAWVPKEMTEVWQSKGRTAMGFARYDKFQRLSVSTAELIKK